MTNDQLLTKEYNLNGRTKRQRVSLTLLLPVKNVEQWQLNAFGQIARG